MSFAATAWAYAQDLKVMNKMVLMVLADCHNGETGKCHPSTKYIAAKAGMSQTSVKRAIAFLAGEGYIKIQHRYHDDGSLSSSHYVMRLGHGGGAPQTLRNATEILQEPGIEPGKEPVKKTKSDSAFAPSDFAKEKAFFPNQTQWHETLSRDPRWPKPPDPVWIENFESVFIAARGIDLDQGRALLTEAAQCAYEWLQTEKGLKKKPNGMKLFWFNWLKREREGGNAAGIRGGRVAAAANGQDQSEASRARKKRFEELQRQADACREERAREQSNAGAVRPAGIPVQAGNV